MQFWNLFNVRYYRTGRSLVSTLVGLCKHQEEAKASVGKGFLFIAMVILLGQVFIVTFAGEMFGVERLGLADWLFLLVITSPILIIGEIGRMVKNRKK
jgi:Ca2+-transporting ATPase